MNYRLHAEETIAAAVEASRFLESVAVEMGWNCGPELGTGAAGFAVWAQDSLGIAAALRIALPDTESCLPIHAVWPELDPDRTGGTAELSVLALRADRRGDIELRWAVCTAMWRECRARGIGRLLAAVPPRNLRVYRRFRWPLEAVGTLHAHWGEPCYPCALDLAEAEVQARALAAANPELRFILELAYR